MKNEMIDVTLAVLAGGRSSRMGFAKQSLQIAGQPILEYLLDRFSWTGPTLLVTAPGRDRPRGAHRFNHEAVDAIENQGPLRGVLTALENAVTRWVIITTVDMPCITNPQLVWLMNRLMAAPQLSAVMMQHKVEEQFQIEPFPLACTRHAAQLIANQLTQGNGSVRSLATLPGFTAETAPADWSPATWTNLNFPEDLQRFLTSTQTRV